MNITAIQIALFLQNEIQKKNYTVAGLRVKVTRVQQRDKTVRVAC